LWYMEGFRRVGSRSFAVFMPSKHSTAGSLDKKYMQPLCFNGENSHRKQTDHALRLHTHSGGEEALALKAGWNFEVNRSWSMDFMSPDVGLAQACALFTTKSPSLSRSQYSPEEALARRQKFHWHAHASAISFLRRSLIYPIKSIP
jgi:hypothetical protein